MKGGVRCPRSRGSATAGNLSRFALAGDYKVGEKPRLVAKGRNMPAVREAAVLRYIRKLAVREECARLPDSKLLDRFVQSGDQEAFAALVRRHGPMVLRVCLQVLDNEHDAEDA